MNPGGRPILVVDDEEEMCWVLSSLLTRGGYECETACNGWEANVLVSRRPFRAAFLDAKLPDIDGLELARQLKATSPDLPIILISGYFYPDNTTVQAAIESGLIAAFFSKPFDHSEVLLALEAQIRR